MTYAILFNFNSTNLIVSVIIFNYVDNIALFVCKNT